MVLTVLQLVVGFALLLGGAEAFVRGAARVSLLLGLPPLIVGLTVVAFATSSPELAVSVKAALVGNGGADVAVGNVVGSNIANILLILGGSAAITPLVVSRQIIRVDVPVMIASSLLVWAMAADRTFQRWEGLVLFLGIVAYSVFTVRAAKREPLSPEEVPENWVPSQAQRHPWLVSLALLVGGLAVLLAGAQVLVSSAIALARSLGVSELVIGLTVVAVGTSLPEIATSFVAAIRGERDIAVGNVVGSNIFNLHSVLGLTALIKSGGVPVAPGALHFDVPVMVAAAVACLPIFFTGRLIARWEGFLFLGYYASYVTYLLLRSTEHDLLPAFSRVFSLFVIPVTVVTLLGLAWRAAVVQGKSQRQ